MKILFLQTWKSIAHHKSSFSTKAAQDLVIQVDITIGWVTHTSFVKQMVLMTDLRFQSNAELKQPSNMLTDWNGTWQFIYVEKARLPILICSPHYTVGLLKTNILRLLASGLDFRGTFSQAIKCTTASMWQTPLLAYLPIGESETNYQQLVQPLFTTHWCQWWELRCLLEARRKEEPRERGHQGLQSQGQKLLSEMTRNTRLLWVQNPCVADLPVDKTL